MGFLTLSETAEFLYKTTSYYAASHEKSIQRNDQALNVAWPLEGFPNISEKDKNTNQNYLTFVLKILLINTYNKYILIIYFN